ncbi:hypothetical protein C6341_g27006, partial [Phytophthora cactorum]
FVAELALIATAADNIAASEWSDTGRDNTCVHSDSSVPPPHPSAAWRVPASSSFPRMSGALGHSISLGHLVLCMQAPNSKTGTALELQGV